MRVSSRPSTSTLVATKRLFATGKPPCRILNGGDNLRVGTAAAQIPAQGRPDLERTRCGLLREESEGREDLPWRAVSALHGVMGDERLLQRMRPVAPKSFDRRDRV